MKIKDLPKTIPVFPLSNFIIFPKTTVPLNIFEPRYIEMINNSMSSNRLIGIIQPKNMSDHLINPELHEIGCLGEITNFDKTKDGRYIIELKGLVRFKIIQEIKSVNKYREYEINFENFYHDLENQKGDIKLVDFKTILKNLRSLFEKRGFVINWKAIEKQSIDETINALAMASPFSLEEKQVLLEAKNLNDRKNKISEILSIYAHDTFENTTLQ